MRYSKKRICRGGYQFYDTVSRRWVPYTDMVKWYLHVPADDLIVEDVVMNSDIFKVGNIRNIDPEYLYEDENNPRISDDALQSVKNSIKDFGFVVPIIINNEVERKIIAGHVRRRAAIELGMETVPCVLVEHLNAKQQAMLNIVENKVSELSDWDADLLRTNFGDILDGTDFNLKDYGWSDTDLSHLMEDTSIEVPDDDQDKPVLEEEKAAKIRIGNISFTVPKSVYQEWLDDVYNAHSFDDERVILYIKDRLGL